MIGTCSKCKQKEQEVRRIYSFQLCKKCFKEGRNNKRIGTVLEKYDKVW